LGEKQHQHILLKTIVAYDQSRSTYHHALQQSIPILADKVGLKFKLMQMKSQLKGYKELAAP
jgi:hypothetical protein